jgi:hypothetical protein
MQVNPTHAHTGKINRCRLTISKKEALYEKHSFFSSYAADIEAHALLGAAADSELVLQRQGHGS